MAIINYTDQIKYAGKGYLDAKMMPVKTFEDLKAIPSTQRFEGLTVVVLNDGSPQDYWLVGGISNSCWKPKTAANFDSLRLVLEEGFLKLMNAEVQLGDSVDFNDFFPESTGGVHITTVDYTAVDDKGQTGIFMCFTYSDGTQKYLNMSQFLAQTYEAGDGIVINGNVISIDDAIKGKFETIEKDVNELKTDVQGLTTDVDGKFEKVNTDLASKADISDIELLESTVTGVSNDVQTEIQNRQEADSKLQTDIDNLRTNLTEVDGKVVTNKENIEKNASFLAKLKERVDTLEQSFNPDVEGAIPDGETIGITSDDRKALCVKILEKEGNMLSVDTHNGATGLYAGFSYFCEDDEIKE